MKYSQDELRRAFIEIESEAKPTAAIIGSIIGAIPAIAFYALIGENSNAIYLLLLAIPPLIIALFARFVGRTYRLKHRLPVAGITAIVHLFGCYLISLSIIAYLLVFIAFLIGLRCSRIKLDKIHYYAIDRFDEGSLDLND